MTDEQRRVRHNELARKRYNANIEEAREKRRILYARYYAKNINSIRKRKREEHKRHRAYYTMLENKRRAAKIERAPAFANTAKILMIYKVARLLSELHGISYEVDHIIPLQGKNVSGLHHEDNLQIITAEENRKKGNRYV